MCSVSMIGDYYHDKWKNPNQTGPIGPIYPGYPTTVPYTPNLTVAPLSDEQIVQRAVELTKKAFEEQKREEETETAQRTVSRQEFDLTAQSS